MCPLEAVHKWGHHGLISAAALVWEECWVLDGRVFLLCTDVCRLHGMDVSRGWGFQRGVAKVFINYSILLWKCGNLCERIFVSKDWSSLWCLIGSWRNCCRSDQTNLNWIFVWIGMIWWYDENQLMSPGRSNEKNLNKIWSREKMVSNKFLCWGLFFFFLHQHYHHQHPFLSSSLPEYNTLFLPTKTNTLFQE